MHSLILMHYTTSYMYITAYCLMHMQCDVSVTYILVKATLSQADVLKFTCALVHVFLCIVDNFQGRNFCKFDSCIATPENFLFQNFGQGV